MKRARVSDTDPCTFMRSADLAGCSLRELSLLVYRVHHSDERIDFYGLPVQHRWTVAPLPHRVQRRLNEQRIAAHHFQRLDAAVGGDDGAKFHFPTAPNLARQRRKHGLYAVNQQRGINMADDQPLLFRRRLGPCWHHSRVKCIPQTLGFWPDSANRYLYSRIAWRG